MIRPKLPQQSRGRRHKQYFLRLKATLEQVDKKTEVVAEKAWHVSQSSNTKSQYLDAEKTKKGFMDLVQEFGGDRDMCMVSLQMQRAER